MSWQGLQVQGDTELYGDSLLVKGYQHGAAYKRAQAEARVPFSPQEL